MLKRTIFLEKPFYLSMRNKQLVAKDKESNTERTAPIEDLGFVILDNPQISVSQRLMSELTENNVALVFCNEKHLPTGMLMRLDGGYQQGGLFTDQINATESLKKQLWKQTIQAKILNQSRLFTKTGNDATSMIKMIAQVKSGDTGNHEAQAARIYWSKLFENVDIEETDKNEGNFRRERFGASPNNMLNYGYAILRAAVARAIVGSGMLPTLGIHHRNRLNSFCLADDIMEPFRPFIDRQVYQMLHKYTDCTELTTEMKADLLKTLAIDTQYDDMTRPLMVGLSVTTASLARCFAGESRKINYPELRNEE